MAIARDDRVLTDAQGRALAGALVYWCLQPATAPSVAPPSPLATIYTAIDGLTPETQPFITDGFGHAWAYMDDNPLYTLVLYHPLFGANPIVWIDQRVGGGGGGSGFTPFQETPAGTIDGVNRVFTLSHIPVQATIWLNFPLIADIGYVLVGNVITYSTAPQPAGVDQPSADNVYCEGWF